MTVRRRAALLLLAAGTVLLGACTDKADALDRQRTQRAVGDAVARQVEPDVTGTRCTGSLEPKAGGTFSCEVTLEGVGTLPVTVRQTDDEGTLSVVPEAAVVDQDRIVTELKATLKDTFERNFQVACEGKAVEIRKPGSESPCVARDATSRREVTVTVTDIGGTLAFEVGGPAS